MDHQVSLDVTRPFFRLGSPDCVPVGQSWHYGLAWPLQVGKRSWGVMCNLRRDESPAVDFEAGTDFVPMDINGQAGVASPVSRNHVERHPVTGEDFVMVKYPATGGFVPAGALRSDGSPHAHEGTGFGIVHAIGFPKRLLGGNERVRFPDDPYQYAEVHQYEIVGGTLRVTGTARTPVEDSRAGVLYAGTSFTAAIPDADDLLFAMRGTERSEDQSAACGVARWQRRGGIWQVVDFAAVPGAEGRFEPSIGRARDGSLIFCARGAYHDDHDRLRVWRSTDGRTWREAVDEPGLLTCSPVTVNVSGDGSPYVAGNPRDDSAVDNRGVLVVWPVTSGGGIGEPVTVLDGAAAFGPSAHESGWMIDHPAGATVRGADGVLRHVLVFRVADGGEVRAGASASPATGCYLTELHTRGPSESVWRFAEES